MLLHLKCRCGAPVIAANPQRLLPSLPGRPVLTTLRRAMITPFPVPRDPFCP